MVVWWTLAAAALAADPSTQDPRTRPYVVVLGVAQDAGHPQAGCDQTCCRAAFAGNGHRVSALGLVDPVAGQHWLLDATPDFVHQEHLLPGELAGVLPTHAHMGHYTGLVHLGREAMGAKGVPVYVMPRMRGFLESNGPWDQLVRLGNIALTALADGVEVVLSPQLSVTPILVPHRDEYSETVGFVVKGPTRRAAYLPDIDKWEKWSRPIELLVGEVDRAWLDGTFFDGDELPGRNMAQIPHPFIVESTARLSAMPADERDKVHFIHFNHTNPVLQPESLAAKQVAEAGLHVAQEGDVYEL